MPYYQQCPVGADLNYGFDRRVERTGDEEEHLDGVCEALERVWRRYDAGVSSKASQGDERGGDGDRDHVADARKAGEMGGRESDEGPSQGERKGGVITWRGMLTRYIEWHHDAACPVQYV